jgi:IS30 family transposase
MNNKYYKHISHDERLLIIDDFKSGYSCAAIAKRRKRHKATIKRTIAKCRTRDFVKVKGDRYEKQ